MLSRFSSQCLTFLGVNPQEPLSKLKIAFNCIETMIITALLLVGVFWDKSAESAESLCISLLIFSTYLIFIFGRKTLQRLLANAQSFWEPNAEDEEIKFMLRHLRLTNKLCKTSLLIASLAYVAKPFILHEESMMSLHKPKRIPFIITYPFEVYFNMATVCCYYPFISLVGALLVSTAVQFRALNLSVIALNNIDLHKSKLTSQIKRIIKYQQFLMGFVDDINKLLSVPLALSLIEGTSLICLEMYGVVMGQTALVVRCKVVQISLCLLAQYLCVYGLPAQFLMHQSTATSDVIYCELDWYLQHFVPLRKHLLVMIKRSQKGVYIRAGGYHVVSNQTVLTVLKTAYSFFTFLQTMVET